MIRSALIFTTLFCLTISLFGRAEKIRVVWINNPSQEAHIGWASSDKSLQTLYVDTYDHGKDTSAYERRFKPEIVHRGYKGMVTQFVHLKGLIPNTRYYMTWGDKSSITSSYFFQTAPEEPTDSISIIVGGDSRNNRNARQMANILVGRLRPHAVMFAGDMTDEDQSKEWQEWLDDWQLTRSHDRRLTPIIPARGNHELSDEVMVKLFNVPEKAYYAQTIGGNLMRVYSLNSEANAGGNQAAWLKEDLANEGTKAIWRIAQYHKPVRPHVARKREGNDQYQYWSPLFYEFGVQLAYECDGHIAKVTWPLRPSTKQGADEGFIRDDRYGTIYLGEGGWGAPLRKPDDAKNWTRAVGSFNHINWLWISKDKLEIRTVIVPAGISQVLSIKMLSDNTRFTVPRRAELWQLPGGVDVVNVSVNKRESELQNLVEESLDGSLFVEENPENQTIFFNAFPIPNNKRSQLGVTCFSREKQAVDLRLFDQRGRLLFKRKLRVVEGDNRFTFDTRKYLKGIYYLAIQQDQGSQVIKLVLD
ncbi:MAG: metallophosphoesterase [Bacteroidia bacterium]